MNVIYYDPNERLAKLLELPRLFNSSNDFHHSTRTPAETAERAATVELQSAAVNQTQNNQFVGLKNAAILEMIDKENELARNSNNDKLSRLLELPSMFKGRFSI